MANAGRKANIKRNTNTAKSNRGMYVEGNTARRLQEVPSRRSRPPQARPAGMRVRTEKSEKSTQGAANSSGTPKQLSAEAQRNREKATSMSGGFVVFLAVVSVSVLFACVHYLQLKSELTAQRKVVAALESELSELKEDNDAYESQVVSNVDLSMIKKIAIGRLGMRYPTEDQVMTYETSHGSYVRQYQDVPDSK